MPFNPPQILSVQARFHRGGLRAEELADGRARLREDRELERITVLVRLSQQCRGHELAGFL